MWTRQYRWATLSPNEKSENRRYRCGRAAPQCLRGTDSSSSALPPPSFVPGLSHAGHAGHLIFLRWPPQSQAIWPLSKSRSRGQVPSTFWGTVLSSAKISIPESFHWPPVAQNIATWPSLAGQAAKDVPIWQRWAEHSGAFRSIMSHTMGVNEIVVLLAKKHE